MTGLDFNAAGTDVFRYEAPTAAPGAPPVLVKARRVQVPYAILSTWLPAEPAMLVTKEPCT